MITVGYLGYEAQLEAASVPYQLKTAVKIGLQRMQKRNKDLKLPQRYWVRYDGERVGPDKSETIITDGSFISIIGVDIDQPGPLVHVLDI